MNRKSNKSKWNSYARYIICKQQNNAGICCIETLNVKIDHCKMNDKKDHSSDYGKTYIEDKYVIVMAKTRNQ